MDRGLFRDGSAQEWAAEEEDAALREAEALRAARHEPREESMSSAVFEEVKTQNRDVERIERAIDHATRIERALRQMHDERKAIGGGSRARIGALLSGVEDERGDLDRILRGLSLDFSPPVGPR